MFPSVVIAAPDRLAVAIAGASPDGAIVYATIGICLIFLELNRPGRILPGAIGLTLLLCATASLGRHPLRGIALLLLAASFVGLAANLWANLPFWLAAAPTLTLSAALRFLLPENAPRHINTPTALTCGLTLGLLGTALSRIALRARRLKAVH